MTLSKKKILVHTCCASCASHVFSELKNSGFEIIAFFYHPELHGKAEYKRRLADLTKLTENLNIKLLVPSYDVQEFFVPLLPYQDKNSIKYVSDKARYKRKRCQLCISLLMQNTVNRTKDLRLKNFTTTMLCSPYKDHDEILDKGLELATKNKLNFIYQDYRKGFWRGRNFARNHEIMIPRYCGCHESYEEGRLE